MNNDIKKLLALSDDELMKRAAEAYWGLKGKNPHTMEVHPGVNTNIIIVKEIPVSIYQAAWEMRDACDIYQWEEQIKHVVTKDLRSLDGAMAQEDYCLRHSQPKHWMIAAMLCWEQKDE